MVLTAADPRESSYACYWDEVRQTFLGDVFSVKWMENADVVSNTLSINIRSTLSSNLKK